MAYIRSHSKRIAIRFRIKGKEYSTTIELAPTTANLKSTKARSREWEARLLSGEPWEYVRADIRGEQRPTTRNSLGYYAQHFLDTAPVERTTLHHYQKSYNRVWLAFDDRPIDGILKSELVTHLASFGFNPKTEKNHISTLRRIFEIAKEDGVIDRAPTDNWKAKRVQKSRKDPYTAEERDALLEALQGQYKAFFTLAFYSGMRTSELVALQPKHLNKPTIRVEQVRVDQHLDLRTKNHRAREVIVPEIVWEALAPYRFGEWVFQKNNQPFRYANDIHEAFHEAHEKASVRPREGRKKYPWRSTYISLALRAGVPPGLVARQTGHDERTMWQDYAEYIPGEDDTETLLKAFEGTTGGTNTP